MAIQKAVCFPTLGLIIMNKNVYFSALLNNKVDELRNQ